MSLRAHMGTFLAVPEEGGGVVAPIAIQKQPSLRRAVSRSSSLRRNTVQTVQMILRRFSRTDLINGQLTEYDIPRMVHECGQLVAVYKHQVMQLGSPSDSIQLRRDIHTARTQCHKLCQSTKNLVLPQLKSASRGGTNTSGDFSKQTSQFLGVLTTFIIEMKRCDLLLNTFPQSPGAPLITNQQLLQDPTDVPGTGGQQPTLDGSGTTGKQEVNAEDGPQSPLLRKHQNSDERTATPGTEQLRSDIEDIEQMLETLENLITVHFSDAPKETTQPAPKSRSRKKGCLRLRRLCTNFKTSYA